MRCALACAMAMVWVIRAVLQARSLRALVADLHRFAAWLARDPTEWNGDKNKRFLDLFWARNFYPHVEMVLNDLHAKGLVKAGDYVIEIDW